MTTTPPGWYDDGHGAMRWWDGAQWTEHVAQPDAETSPAPTEAEILAGGLGFDQPRAVDANAAAGGGFAAATEPRSKSKLWIVWVVLGVVLLGIVIAAAVVIPLLLLSASTANSAGQSDDERAAVATVGLYDDAWQEGDCEKLVAATTEQFRTSSDLGDCAAFADQAAAFSTGIEDYTVNITDVETVGDEITVTTNETYTALVDENGEPAEPTEGAQVYEYTLVESDGEWLIDYLYSE
ncbi:DUF2510 domain-containing protein [Microbacterium trichothecenolyticum]|uniref:DUF2510 domain-containing protein n=1 Tax=Microbacterium ureisolvens TaxID=2781186 RepID=A0ABS7I5D3_9MICO|nr:MULTISPECIES: DUF2510 domain-containing protein [Microbacterium]MBW9111268.1 DUF2510 domain-containing protein [Microbacterium ureisolvens]MBW9121419.1 DUF2510 domain-containing protein [Microbacterium trichothecenolyticum]